jgi:predicted Zn-dependent peptidase
MGETKMKTQLLKYSKSLRLLLPVGLVLAFVMPTFGQAGGAQAPPQLSQVERKNRAPISKDVLRVNLPKPAEFTLPNGLTVLVLEDHRLPLVSVQLSIDGAGGLYDPANLPGLAGTTAQMLREGTKTRSSKQLAEEIDAMGASITAGSASTSASTTMNASGLSENFDKWFPVAIDVLLHPSFPAAEFANIKQRQKAGLISNRTQPNFLAQERFNRAIYGNFPAAVVASNVEAIDAMTTENLMKWHDEHYAPQNAILAISGDVNAATLVPKLRQWLADWQKTNSSPKLPPAPTAVQAKNIYLVDRPNSVQTTLFIGNVGFDRRSPDYVAYSVLNGVLGGSAAARLFMNLRENKGYTYGVYTTYNALQYPGFWRAYGDFRSDVTGAAMGELLNEFNRIRNEKVPESELEEAKRAIVAGFALQLESPQTVMSNAIIRKIYGFPVDYWDNYPAQVMAITADDVQRVAKKYIDPNTMQVVAVGDGSKIKAMLEKFGTVEMYATDGKPAAAKPAAAPGSN